MEMKTIRLYGALGTKFGRVHRIAVTTGTEAVKALCYTVDGFREYLNDAKNIGMKFSIFYGKEERGIKNITDPCGNSDIRIAPVITGSKRAGMFQAIMGAVIIAAAVAAGPAGFALVSASAAWTIGLSGALSVAGGLYQMLSPQTSGLAMRQDADNKPSYAFGGPVNSTAMGNVVGVLFGEREIGGAVISAGIVAEDQ
ncbi:MAG: hypothetical protein [Bacteriophage sp.]|nr:MAG: hypothetical protein [Bacteriophage sp.]